MAATAEALINTLAGGGDSGSATESTGGSTQQHRSDTGGDPGDQGSGDRAGIGESQQVAPDNGETGSVQVPAADSVKPTPEQLYQNAQAAIRETRGENKALKAQLQELTAKIEALSKPPTKAEEPPPEPDFLADPKAYVDDAKSKLAKLTEQIESDKKQQTEAQQKQQQAQETWNKVIAAESEFAAATPDYYDAINHVRAIRAEQIKIEFRESEDREPTADEIGAIISVQEANGARTLIAKGKNPSKFYYEYAKTFGYKPKAAADQATTTTATSKPDKDAVRTMGSGGAADSGGGDEPAGDSPLGGLLAAAQNEHRAQFRRKKS